ncbi:MAG: hypothetical protein V3U96_12310 [Paracoccaceae bacterium]
MAKNLKDAFEKHGRAAAELDQALRECLSELRCRPEVVVGGRFRVVEGGKPRQSAKM